jgi:sulfoxide reductase heme-binding subunit YedZ
LFLAALYPLGWLLWAAYYGNFSADPLADITHETGDWTLRFLCITLAITPLRRVTGWNGVIRFRRMLGLFAFFYGTLHLLIYLIADRYASLDFPQGVFAWQSVRAFGKSIWVDVAKRKFITMGFTAWLCMLPLALTSTAGWIRRLGGKTWNRLHQLVYAAAVAGVIHYYWLVKADVRRPLTYAAIVFVLLAFRAAWKIRGEASAGSRRTVRTGRW